VKQPVSHDDIIAATELTDRSSYPQYRVRGFPAVRELWIALVLLLIVALAANVVGDIIARGWIGIGNQHVVERWVRVGEILSRDAAVFGLVLLFFSTSLSLTAQGALWIRLACMFATVPILVVVVVALSRPIDSIATLILVFSAFACAIAAIFAALRPPDVRVVGLAMCVAVAGSALRLGSGLAPDRVGIAMNTLAWLLEFAVQVLVFAYVASRTRIRGKVVAALELAVIAGLVAIALTTRIESQGTLRDAFQRGLSLRAGGSAHPFWMARVHAVSDIAFLDRSARLALAPSLVVEASSFVLAGFAMFSVTKRSLWTLPLLALIVLSRGQLEVPLRSLECVIACIFAVLLAGRMQLPGADFARDDSLSAPPSSPLDPRDRSNESPT
jgi:hypothetical protein